MLNSMATVKSNAMNRLKYILMPPFYLKREVYYKHTSLSDMEL